MLDFHWLVLKAGAAAVEHFSECHELWLCPREQMAGIIEEVGFSVSIETEGLSPGRDLLVCRRKM